MLKLILELGPLIVFLITYKYSNIFLATMLMIGVTSICLFLSYLVDKKISIPLLLSGGILIVAGGITLVTQDSKYIKMKPTIVYLIFSFILFIGVMYKKPLVKNVLGNTFIIDDKYWMILSKRFAYFFIMMAIVNEIVWRNYSESFWINFKVFGAIPISLLFMATQVPFLNKYGKLSDEFTKKLESKTNKKK